MRYLVTRCGCGSHIGGWQTKPYKLFSHMPVALSLLVGLAKTYVQSSNIESKTLVNESVVELDPFSSPVHEGRAKQAVTVLCE